MRWRLLVPMGLSSLMVMLCAFILLFMAAPFSVQNSGKGGLNCWHEGIFTSGGCSLRRENEVNGTVENVTKTTTIIDLVIEKSKTVPMNTSTSPSKQNLSVIEKEMGNGPPSGGDFFSDSLGLSSDVQVMLWVFTIIFSVCALVLMWISSYQRNNKPSAAAWVKAMLMLTSMFFVVSLGYLAMALDVGRLYEVVGVKVYPGIVTTAGNVIMAPIIPPVYWVRHLSWAMSTPLQLLLLMHVAEEGGRAKGKEAQSSRRVPFTTKVFILGLNWCLHACGLIGTLVPHVQLGKWTYWVAGLLFYLMLIRALFLKDSFLVSIANKNKTRTDYRLLVRFIVISWTPYPLVWAISDGSRTVNADVREALYVVLEVVNKLGFLGLFLDICAPRDNFPSWLKFLARIIGAMLGRRSSAGSNTSGHDKQSQGMDNSVQQQQTHDAMDNERVDDDAAAVKRERRVMIQGDALAGESSSGSAAEGLSRGAARHERGGREEYGRGAADRHRHEQNVGGERDGARFRV